MSYSIIRDKWDMLKNRPSTSKIFFQGFCTLWKEKRESSGFARALVSVGHPDIMPKIQPSTRNQYVEDPVLKMETPDPSEVAPDKKKMNPRDQRKYVASKPKHSFKNLPKRWSREKVARAYETALLRGIPKSTWLEKWAEKYDFSLCRWKVRRRVIP